MENGELAAIRIANIRKITDALARKMSPMSRAELSAVTGLSLMTVGKTADQLEQFGIITQKKREGGSPGRKSQAAFLDEKKRFSIYDYSGAERMLFVTDQVGRIFCEYRIPDGGFDDIAAQAFMECAMNDCELVGCGLILPDLEPGKAVKEFREQSDTKPDAVFRLCEASALGFCTDEHSVLHVKAADELCGAIVLNGRLYKGACGRACDLKALSEHCGGLSGAVRAVCLTFDPQMVRIEAESEAELERLSGELTEALAGLGLTLDFVGCDHDRVVAALAAALLEKRISKIFDLQ